MAENPLFGKVDRSAENAALRERLDRDRVPPSVCDTVIAEHIFRRPVRIPYTDIGIRPFWRDGKKAPPLKPGVRHYPSGHY